MDATGNPANLEQVEHGRRAQRLLAVQNNLLLGLDVCAGMALAYLSARIYLFATQTEWPRHSIAASLSREVILGSIIAALALREPLMADDAAFIDPRGLIRRLVMRAAAVASILISVGLATRPFGDAVRLWLLGWSAVFLAWIGVSRGFIVAYFHQLAMLGLLREALAVVGAPDVASRLAARLATEAAIVAVFDDELSDFDDDLTDSNDYLTDSDDDLICLSEDAQRHANGCRFNRDEFGWFLMAVSKSGYLTGRLYRIRDRRSPSARHLPRGLS